MSRYFSATSKALLRLVTGSSYGRGGARGSVGREFPEFRGFPRERRGFTFRSLSYSISSGRCRWIRALKASPSFQLWENGDQISGIRRENGNCDPAWAPGKGREEEEEERRRAGPDVEVLDVDVLVRSRFPLAPEQEPLLGRGLCGSGNQKWIPDGSRGRIPGGRIPDGSRGWISGVDAGGGSQGGCQGRIPGADPGVDPRGGSRGWIPCHYLPRRCPGWRSAG